MKTKTATVDSDQFGQFVDVQRATYPPAKDKFSLVKVHLKP